MTVVPQKDTKTAATKFNHLIVYGGSFDPPHFGHRECIFAALDEQPNSKVVVLPAARPAVASNKPQKSMLLPYGERIRLCRKTFIEDAPPELQHRIEVSQLELSIRAESAHQPSQELELLDGCAGEVYTHLPTNYTVDTLRYIANKLAPQKSTELYFLMGQDQLQSFHLWNRPIEILDQCSLMVAARHTPTSMQTPQERRNSDYIDKNLAESDLQKTVKTTFSALNVGLKWDNNNRSARIEKNRHSIYLLTKVKCGATSSGIRSMIQSGKNVPSNWVPNGVVDQIKSIICSNT